MPHDDDQDVYLPNENEPIHQNTSITRGQLFALTVAFMTRHSLTTAAIADLILLLNTILPSCLPENIYFFNKVLHSGYCTDTYVYCDVCEVFLGKFDGETKNAVCSACEKNVFFADMVKKGCFFIVYPLEKSLRTMLEDNDLGQCLIDTAACSSTSAAVMADITDGDEYQRKNILPFPNSISLSCNIDGVPVFKSSNTSMWPIFYVVNNLPFSLRRENLILHGLWCGPGKPKMECFLKPVVNELIDLHDSKLVWRTKAGVEMETTVHCDLFVCDSVARPALQNIKQFNGKFGCGFCMHEGVLVSKGQGTVRTYPSGNHLPELRTHEQTVELACQAESTHVAVSGVKGISLLYLLPDFDIITGFNPECMHSVMLGVVRQFASLWMDSQYSGCAFSIRAKSTMINSLLVSIKPPSEVKRLPRSLESRCYWKASEWRAFLLLYSVVILKGVLPDRYYNHWILLVYSVYSMHQKLVDRTCLLTCDLALNKFVAEIPHLYGAEFVSYNVHLLVHLVESVKNWGPLWATSAFVFEDANRILMRLLHGTRTVSKQVFQNFHTVHYLKPMAKAYFANKCDQKVAKLFNKLSHLRVPCTKAVRFEDGVVGVGHRIISILSVGELLAVEAYIGTSLPSIVVTRFSRIIVNGMVMHTVNYSAKFKRNDSLVSLHNHSGVFALHSVVQLPATMQLVCFFQRYRVHQVVVHSAEINVNLCKHVWHAHQTENLVACSPTDIGHKCIGLNSKSSFYCMKLPFFELD